MSTQALLDAVRNDGVQFVTMRPRGSAFAVLDRKVVITAPPELDELAGLGDPDVLDELVDLLDDPDRAWAAAVVLSAATGRDAKQIESFSASPDEWWATLGETAQERWRDWLQDTRDRLRWDPAARTFVMDG